MTKRCGCHIGMRPSASSPAVGWWLSLTILAGWAMGPRASLAQPPADWGGLGPAGGAVSSVAPVPATAGMLWVGAPRSGVWRSIDGGISWVQTLPAAVSIVAADPADPLTVFAATSAGLEKSADGGATWSLVRPGVEVVGLAVPGSPPGAVYEVETGPDLYGPSMLLMRSADGGATWQQVTLPWPWVDRLSLAADPADANRIYLAGTRVAAPPFAIRSADGGATWETLTGAPAVAQPLSLRLDASDAAVLYGWTGAQGELFRSPDRGTTWQQLPGAAALSPIALAVDPANGALYAAVSGPPGEIWKSSDHGTSWSRVFQHPTASATILALSVDPNLPGRVYAADNIAGLMASDDAGATWRSSNLGLDMAEVTDLAADAVLPGVLYAVFAAGGPPGAARSYDGGITWGPINQLANADLSAITRIVADPFFPETVYAAGGDVWKSTNGGNSWRALGVPGATSVEIQPGSSSSLLATGLGTSSDLGTAAAISVDGGEVWTPISKNQFHTPDGSLARLTAAAIDPVLVDLLYVAGPGALLYSVGGQTWSRLEKGLPPGQDVVRLRPGRNSDGSVAALFAVLTPGPHSLYRNSPFLSGVWTATDTGLPAGVPVRDLLIDPRGSPMWAATDAGIYRSADYGATWTAFASGLADPRATRLIQATAGAAAAYGAALYAGTAGGGLYQSPPRRGRCYASDTLLCLLAGRFSAQLAWTAADGTSGLAHARSLADASGSFWFFSPDSTEVLVKMVDGGPVNGHSWVFAGGLSGLAYTLTLTDVQTGGAQTYSHPPGTLASIADTGSFQAVQDPLSADILTTAGGSGPPPGPGPCAPARDALCLQQGRFRIAVSWQPATATAPAPAMAVPLSQATGAFWFASPKSPELTLKVLDGRAIDGHFWIFSGGLSSLGYTVSVTDTATGQQQSYVHAAGGLASELHLF